MRSRLEKASQKIFGLDPHGKESGQDNTSKNGNVVEDSRVLCVDQNLLIKSLIWSFYSNRQSEI